ncbi:hypothetical protein JOD24_001848 [Kroppenstedtia sanguinis]|uniref:DUF3231 family protein n=1 Tax=Kroppenstedtia sanguinis TaxID=1380684 RepID=UPI003D250488
MSVMSENPVDEPMHYGEVFAAWSYLSATKGKIAGYQTMLNHTGDEELRDFIEDMIKTGRREEEQIERLLKENGVVLPPTPPERPVANLESIPVGARFNDPEIAVSIARDLTMGMVACSQAMGESIREDIGMMFGQFHMKKTQAGTTLLRMQKEKGWLVPPPLHLQEPVGTL